MFVSIDYANKLVARLQQHQNELIVNERSVNRYSYYSNETPVVPEYDFTATQAKIDSISACIIKIKHDIREMNMKNVLKNMPEFTVDEAILMLSFLSKKKMRIVEMANMVPERALSRGGAQGSEVYKANFDVSVAKKEYNDVCNQIIHIQDELNTFNILTQIKIDDEVEKLFED